MEGYHFISSWTFFQMSQFQRFQTTDTTVIAMPACSLGLIQPRVKFPSSKPLTGCASCPCRFPVVVMNVGRTDINRYDVSGNANPATLRLHLQQTIEFLGSVLAITTHLIQIFVQNGWTGMPATKLNTNAVCSTVVSGYKPWARPGWQRDNTGSGT